MSQMDFKSNFKRGAIFDLDSFFDDSKSKMAFIPGGRIYR